MTRPMLETAAALVVAVADRDHLETAHILRDLDPRALRDLAVTLAARVNTETPWHQPPLPVGRAVRQCLTVTAEVFGLDPRVLVGPSRRRDHIDARHVAMYAGRLCGASYPMLAAAFSRDHTTAMYACGRVGELPRLRAVAQQVAERVGRDTGEWVA